MIHSLNRYTLAKPTKKLGLTHVGRAKVATMINDGATNLSGKSLSTLIHYFIGILTKIL